MAKIVKQDGKIYYRTLRLKPFAQQTVSEMCDVLNAYYNGEVTADKIKQYWKIGDTITIHNDAITNSLGNQPATDMLYRIVSFDHYPLSNPINEIKQNFMCLHSHYTFPGLVKIDETAANVNYVNHNIFNYVNNLFVNSLPESVINALKSCTIPYQNSGSSSTVVYTNVKAAIPSWKEIYTWNHSAIKAYDGTIFPYYKTAGNPLKYDMNTGAKVKYWTRTFGGTNGLYSWAVNTSSTGTGNVGNVTTAAGFAPVIFL